MEERLRTRVQRVDKGTLVREIGFFRSLLRWLWDRLKYAEMESDVGANVRCSMILLGNACCQNKV